MDLAVEWGQVHALLGENGAGKSTLMNVVYGLVKPDSGEVSVDGRPASIKGPQDAIRLGIGMVHQHFMLIPPLTVAENIILGRETSAQYGVVDRSRAVADVLQLSRRYGLEIDPSARVEGLSVGIQQRVEILKTLFRGARILILDEPTAVLTPQETERLFDIIRNLARDGTAVIFITHKLGEVMKIADQITVMRRGKVVGELVTKDTNEAEIARMMVGREVLLRVDKKPARPGPVALAVENLTAETEQGVPALRGLSFQLHEGEILGLAGVEGNGQSELIEVLAGTRKPSQGRVLLGERDITGMTADEIRRLKVAHIPEDRRGAGLVLNYSVADNLVLGRERSSLFSWQGIVLRIKAILAWARRLIKEFDIRTPGPETPARALSGGNQQKIIVAREMASNPTVLLAAQPTRGVDIGAIEFIHRRIVAERDQGTAVLLVSAELEEIRSLSDRIAVIYEGRIVGEESPDASEERLGLLMTGGGQKRTGTGG